MEQKFSIEQDEIYVGWLRKLQIKGRNHNELLAIVIRASARYFGIYETWEDVVGYEGLYQVDSFGRIKSLNYNHAKKERLLKLGINNRGYLQVVLYKNEIKKTKTVHQLSTMSFFGHQPNGRCLVVNHKNFIKTDNRLKNLEIVTMRENSNKKHLKSTSKYVGVSWDKGVKKWGSSIRINGIKNHLGFFVSEIDASNAYQNALKNIE